MGAMEEEYGIRQMFLNGMSHAASTVNVVTTDGPVGRAGVTVSAMSSVSADTSRPTLLVCVHHLSPAAAAIIGNEVFCVNVLRDDQTLISDSFSGRLKDGKDKFACAEWTVDVTGAPRVVNPLVAFDCRLVSSERIGTHHVFMGEVEHVFIAESGSPLIYANRAYGTASRLLRRRDPGAAQPFRLRIGSYHTFGPYVVPEVLERMSAGGEDITLQLLEGDQQQILEGLNANEIEIALMFDFDLGEDFVVERLDAVQAYILLPEGHRLAGRQSIALKELVDEPLILLETPPAGRYFISLFEEQGLTPNIAYRTRSFEMARGLVGHGLGYSVLATKPASNMSYDGRGLVAKPLASEATASHVAFVYRRSHRLSDAAESFRLLCHEIFHERQISSAT